MSRVLCVCVCVYFIIVPYPNTHNTGDKQSESIGSDTNPLNLSCMFHLAEYACSKDSFSVSLCVCVCVFCLAGILAVWNNQIIYLLCRVFYQIVHWFSISDKQWCIAYWLWRDFRWRFSPYRIFLSLRTLHRFACVMDIYILYLSLSFFHTHFHSSCGILNQNRTELTIKFIADWFHLINGKGLLHHCSVPSVELCECVCVCGCQTNKTESSIWQQEECAVCNFRHMINRIYFELLMPVSCK